LPKRWVTQLTLLAAWLGVSVAIGFLAGQPVWGLAIGALLYITRTLYRLRELDQALTTGKRARLFATEGLWAELHARVFKLQTKARARKRRFLRLLREVRESTGAIDEAGIILNAQREIMWFNPAARKLLGLNDPADIGHRLDNLLRNPGFVEYLRGDHRGSILVPSPVDDHGMLSIQVVPYGNDQFLAIARDVTHEIDLARSRRDFVANASHELRSPLTVIGGYLDALADDPEISTDWRNPISEMLRQVQRMTQILRDLIELTRLESTDTEADYDFVSPKDLLQRIVKELSDEKGPKLELELRTDAGVLGNESELHSIFYNVIHNAVRFTPVGGVVTVSWSLSPDGAVFAVRDTGIGISKEQIPRLTERFYRVDPSRSRATGGTGLGLAIVKHALQRHGGRLEIDSREGVGSTFSCHFPRSRIVTREGHAAAVV
jgi:two-component system, OmpR family, phosphate regulon sensor histidine kinase PhoR